MKIEIALAKVLPKKGDNWFEQLTREEQEEYVKAHPRSKYAKQLKAKTAEQQPAKEKTSRATQVSHATKTVDGKRVLEDGSPLPEHIQKLVIPPAWTDVKINPDPDGDLLAMGRDAKGRLQPIYSERFAQSQAEAKFMRVQQLAHEFEAISKQNDKDRRSKDERKRDSADCAFLIMRTGLRPGSDDDTGAEKKAYGATTLEGKHVVIEGGKVFLRFTGKKGVSLNLEMDDPEVVKMLKKRKKEAGEDGKLFSKTHDKALLDYTHTLDGGHFKTKDFRTHMGTHTAMKEVAAMEKPKNEKEYKKAVMAVAKKVSAKLGNTPTMALQAYINPVVFADWRMQ